MAEVMLCPFCGFKADKEYTIQLHIEEHHTEDSPFVVDGHAHASPAPSTTGKASSGNASNSDENPWVKCTRPGCGEYILISDINDHLELHEATAASDEEDRKSSGRPTPATSQDQLPRLPPRRTPPPSHGCTGRERNTHHLSGTYLAMTERNPSRSPQKQQSSSRPLSSGNGQRGRGVLDYFSGASSHGSSVPLLPQNRRPGQVNRVREPREPGRLGTRELGPHAFEQAMPALVRQRLIEDAKPYHENRIGRDGRLHREVVVENETSGVINVLRDICAQDRSTEVTYLCDPSVRHIVKIKCDGNFCGYWNIQMLLSYLHEQSAKASGSAPQSLPNVLEIQDVIERAWASGICSYGRIETGGVRGTRKWIGTHEALAFFTQLGVPVEALSFKNDDSAPPNSNRPPSPASQSAVSQLLDHIEAYFMSGLESAQHYQSSRVTSLPPIYFQRFGHSMTIVGLERKKADGSRNLLVFDSSFATAAPMRRLLANTAAHGTLATILRPYRRSDVSLSRWDEFEVIVPRMSENGKKG